MLLKIPSIIQKISTMVDGGISITLHTQEFNPEDQAKLFKLHKKTGWFVFAEKANMITENELKNLPDLKLDDNKTPSERLRARLYVYYTEHLKRDKSGFNDWYIKTLNEIGAKYLERMEE